MSLPSRSTNTFDHSKSTSAPYDTITTNIFQGQGSRITELPNASAIYATVCTQKVIAMRPSLSFSISISYKWRLVREQMLCCFMKIGYLLVRVYLCVSSSSLCLHRPSRIFFSLILPSSLFSLLFCRLHHFPVRGHSRRTCVIGAIQEHRFFLPSGIHPHLF